MAHTHGRAGRPGLATVKPLARPLCVGGGAMPPDDLARVGAGTPLDRAYGHRLPQLFSSRWGGSIDQDHAARAACPTASQRFPERRRGRRLSWFGAGRGQHLKPLPYRKRGGEGSIPRGHNSTHQAGDMGAALGGTSGSASGVGVVRLVSPDVLRRTHATAAPDVTGLAPYIHTQGNHLHPARSARGWGVFCLSSELFHHPA